MKHIKFSSLISAVAILISACSPEVVPTMNAVDVQSTAVAAAFTLVAQTQAAIPTATPLPPTELPTETPLPTNTPAALPSLEVTATTASLGSGAPAGGAATVDPCSTRVLSAPKGRETIIRIANLTKAPVTVSLYLDETAGQGECGYRAYNLSKSSDVVISDLVQGCYYLWAWSTDPKIAVNSSGSGCINNPDKWTFEISANSIKFVGP